VEHEAEDQENDRGLLRRVLEEMMGSKISQFLNSVIVAELRMRSHCHQYATRTRSKFAFL
jgi:hypothetical protein